MKLARVEEIGENGDFVRVDTRVTAKRKGIVGEGFLKKGKGKLEIINVGRGGIIDEEGVVNGLDE
ncbi:NAD(P)-dependent oxidoreductase [Staphylococcus pasteuri]|uniref:NAD(P)-dependent oxidoreductase n=1 Tax=Staphylococcus pasteuri TaxID=45972 RepID=UPI0021C1F38F|nr:NAD(P)-dependent oxidoreductase [Staphylococcus pasteuri]